MRILMLLKYPLFGSGSGTYVRKLAEKLAVLYSQDEVAIFCPDAQTKLPGVKIFPFDMPFKAVATGHPNWPSARIYSSLTNQEVDQIYMKALSCVVKTVNHFKPDIIHVHHALYFTWIANYIRAVYGIYYVVTSHGTELLTAAENKRWVPLTKDALQRAWMINAVSGDTKKWLLKIYGSKGLIRCTRIIPGGVDLDAFNHDSPIRLINKKYHLNGKRVVIFAGKLTKKKGVEYLIKAASKIKAEVFIIGGGEDKTRLEKLSKSIRNRNVHFLGYFGPKYLRELREFYRRADVFVFPSVWDEPLGLVALEAMASSTPVVASRKGGIPLAVKNNVNGFLVRARSAKEIAEKVNYLLNHEEVRQRMGKEARKIVEEKFNWHTIARKFHTHYEQAHQASKKRLQRMKLPVDIEQERLEIKGKKIDYI
ncbi:MAG TPA: glycosyltransferase family 4 protein [Patescibacteria group bacterium]|nr:glycosyltransferase family 4 protein [Patescibacteria group bacterium]